MPESGSFSVFHFQDERLVLAEAGGASGSVPTRVALPRTDLEAPDGWPAAITLEGTVTCSDGAESASAPITVQVVPARARLGIDDAIWPGYQFWPRPDGTVLFCEDATVVRLDADGARLAQSGDIGCQLDTTMQARVDRLVFVSGDEIAVLDRRTLAVLYAVRADFVAVGQHQLALLRQSGPVFDEAPELEVIALDDGASMGRWSLDETGVDLPLAAPHIDSRSGLVTVLTANTRLDLPGGDARRWQIDPMSPDVPEPTWAGAIPPNGALVLQAPAGWLLGPDRALLVGPDDTLVLRMLDGGDEVWSIQLDSPPRAVALDGHGLLLYAGAELVRVDADGTLMARWKGDEGDVAMQPAVHRDGGVIAALRLDDEAEEQLIVFLDARLEPVWQFPFRFAFGAAFDDDGGPW